MGTLHEHTGLTALEEGWMVRLLRREYHLSQGAVGHLLGRHQSWVSRRLMLVELLDDAVQADVRLGLLSARAAVAVAGLPHSSQQPAAKVVMRRGMTSRQAEEMVARLRQLDSDEERREALRHWGDPSQSPSTQPRPSRLARPVAEGMMVDIAAIRRASVKLEVWLMSRPLASLGPDAAEQVRGALGELTGVLTALEHAIARAITMHKELDDVPLAHP